MDDMEIMAQVFLNMGTPPSIEAYCKAAILEAIRITRADCAQVLKKNKVYGNRSDGSVVIPPGGLPQSPYDSFSVPIDELAEFNRVLNEGGNLERWQR